MAFSDILGKILEDAREEERETRSRGEADAEQFLEAARAEAQSIKEELLRQGEESAREENENELAGLRLEARKEVLSLKKKLLSKVFQELAGALRAQPPAKYADFLASLIDPALAETPAQIEIGMQDLDRFGKDFQQLVSDAVSRRLSGGNFTVRKEPGQFDAGLVVRSGTIVHNLSLGSLLAESREGWEIETAKTLFSS